LWLSVLLFGVAFFGCAELGGLFSSPNHTYVSFWLPAGLFTGVLLLNETRSWGWFVLAALPANLLFDGLKGTTVASTLGFFVADTSGVLAGAWLVRRFVSEKPGLTMLKEYWGLLILAGLLGTVPAATLGAGTLVVSGLSHSYGEAWRTWWSNSAMAVSLLTPFILVWFSKTKPGEPFFKQHGRMLEAALLTALLTGLTWYVLVEDQGINAPYKVWFLPLLLWAGLRFGLRGATAANLWLALLTGFLTSHFLKGLTPADIASGDYIPTIQSFLAISLLVTLIPTIVIQERNRKVVELQQSEERFQRLTQAAFEGICISENGRVCDVNDPYLKMFGYERAEMLGKAEVELRAPEARKTTADPSRTGREPFAGHPLVRKDGSVFYAEAQSKMIQAGQRTLRMTAVRDITERKMFEGEIARLSRLYAALSQINQVIVHGPSRDELYAQVCRILVEFGGFTMVWIGEIDRETMRVVPIAQFGDQAGLLKRAVICADDRPEGRGTVGTAIREEKECISNDFFNDPRTEIWHDLLREIGHQSTAAFPIRRGGVVCGTIGVYSQELGFFQNQEIALLKEVALDVSFALDELAEDEAHRQAEEALRKHAALLEEETAVRKEAELRLASIINSTHDMISYVDAVSLRMLIFNQAMETNMKERWGVRIHLGMTPEQMLPADVARQWRGYYEHTLQYGALQTEYDLENLGKKFEITFHLIQGEGAVAGISVFAEDITERKRAELALRVLNQTLEIEVGERTKELQAALVRAEAADRIKSAFLATMSHELRTPLNSIIGFTGVILQGLAGPLNAEQTKQLGMVRSSARHLLELINDVLDISKIEAGQLEVHAEPFDLRAVIERVTALVKPLADKKGLAVSTRLTAEPGEMVSDRRRVEQVLLNLLNNAIKFTDRGGVTLTYEPVAGYRPGPGTPEAPGVRLRVTDTGLGIKPEDLATLFQPFRQIDSGLARQHEGTGLGLVICRRLTGLLGGEISAASEHSMGSEFTVTLPRQIPFSHENHHSVN
jgi:PAS domain S-box-containing protein